MSSVETAKQRLEAALTRLEQAVERRPVVDSVLQSDVTALKSQLSELEVQNRSIREKYDHAVSVSAELTNRLDGAIDTVKRIVAEH